jgi:hypothetical protein
MLLESLLAETFGVPVSDPRVQGVVAVLGISKRRQETIDLHNRIDTLNRQGVPTSVIALRLGMHRVSVSKIVKTLHDSRVCKK